MILLCDPLRPTRELLHDAFRDELGAFVAGTETPDELVRQLDEVHPSLLFVELTHESGGIELLRRIQRHPTAGAVPILAIVKPDSGPTCAEALAAGCDECLEKPFAVGELVARAGRLIGVTPISEMTDGWSQGSGGPRPL